MRTPLVLSLVKSLLLLQQWVSVYEVISKQSFKGAALLRFKRVLLCKELPCPGKALSYVLKVEWQNHCVQQAAECLEISLSQGSDPHALLALSQLHERYDLQGRRPADR